MKPGLTSFSAGKGKLSGVCGHSDAFWQIPRKTGKIRCPPSSHSACRLQRESWLW